MGKRLEIVVPKGLNELTVSQYQNYAELAEGLDDPIRLNEIAIMCFCNVSIEHLRLLSSFQVNDISARLSVVMEEFSKDQHLIRRFRLEGVEYGFIPNLDKITYGENRDIVEYLKGGVKDSHKAMAVLFRPIKKSYNATYEIDKYETPVKHQMLMKDMPLHIMLGAQVFFWNLIKELLDHIPKYLQKAMGEKSYRELIQKVSTKQTGDGMMNFIT
tara:strand:+ start:2681 stop:3325 length:645 start_codon:yes stop_codon:yes gene_type:complete